MTDPVSGYRQIDHTADVALEIWAPSEPELLVTGARALVDILTQGADIRRTGRRRVALAAVDPEDRLVQWLNEVLVAAIMDGFLFADADIELHGPDLSAEIVGQAGAGDLVVTELKSVTYHDLALEVTAGHARCRVIIDV